MRLFKQPCSERLAGVGTLATGQCINPQAGLATRTGTKTTADALFVCEGADHGAKDHGGAKARDEQLADLAHVKAIKVVQPVHVGALQPVAGCREGREGSARGASGSGGAAAASERARRREAA